MSRSLSAAALREMFAPESDDTLIVLLTLSGGGISGSIRLADNYTTRISETADEVVYGVTSRTNDYTFLPIEVTLPTEEHEAAPRCQLTLHDVTQIIMPEIRTLTGPPSVLLELVLVSDPDTVEASFPGLMLAGVSYNADTISGELTVASLASEPFPAHTFTPSYFPGLF